MDKLIRVARSNVMCKLCCKPTIVRLFNEACSFKTAIENEKNSSKEISPELSSSRLSIIV